MDRFESASSTAIETFWTVPVSCERTQRIYGNVEDFPEIYAEFVGNRFYCDGAAITTVMALLPVTTIATAPEYSDCDFGQE
jgi:hypothetical protein